MKSGIIDTSNELHLYRYDNGVKLVRPEEANRMRFSHRHRDTVHTVSSIMKLPLCIYFSNMESMCQNMNDPTLEACGFSSLKEAQGNTLHRVLTTESVEQIEKNDKTIVTLQTTKIFEENSLRKDNVKTNVLSVKLPWYDNNNSIIGLMGCSLLLGKHSIATGLEAIAKAGLLNLQEQSPIDSYMQLNKVTLSQREKECLEMLTKGFSSKKIAIKLYLSHRTVENYIANIKSKLQVSTKNELLEKVIGY